MSQAQLDRRHVLSGGLAFASACMVAGRAGAVSPMEDAATILPRMELKVLSEREVFGMTAAEAAACHAPFRSAFLAWLGEASGRLALPLVVDTAEPSCTDLHVPDLHPALEFRLDGETGINVFVQWRGVCWDILASMDVYATPEPDGSGWRNTLLISEAQFLHLTREACWQEDGFEWLLRWLNDDLATATHLALCGGDDCYGGEDWTSAHLVRDGLLVPCKLGSALTAAAVSACGGDPAPPSDLVSVPKIGTHRIFRLRPNGMWGTSKPGKPGYKDGHREADQVTSKEEADRMNIIGIDISKRRFDVALLTGRRTRQAAFSNTETGFKELLTWLSTHRSSSDSSIHACMEATGNWGLDLAEVLHGEKIRVSIVNPLRVKAYGQSELARNRTDKLDAALIARFCQAHQPAAWTPPATHMRELRELVRRCDNLKAARVQEINRQKSGMASPAVAASIAAHLAWLDLQIEEVMAAVQLVIDTDIMLCRNQALLLSIPGIGVVTAAILLAELPNISDFTLKGLAAFAGLSPQEHSSGTTVRRPGRISRMGSERLRRALYMCALSSKRRNPALVDFVKRMTAAGKPPKVILLAVARKLLVFAHAIVRTQKTFALASNIVSDGRSTSLKGQSVC